MSDVGEHCIDCGESVAWGSGNYVNRTPADDGTLAGWKCAGCMGIECDRCGEMIALDEDITPSMCGLTEFEGGSHFLHGQCLNPDELKRLEENA